MTSFTELLRDAIRTRPKSHPVWNYNTKLQGRGLARSLGLNLPALYAGPGRLDSLVPPTGCGFVVKPNSGHSARGVAVLEWEGEHLRDLLTGKERSWGGWVAHLLGTKRLPSKTSQDTVRPPWMIEEKLGEPGQMPLEAKFYVFADGSVPLVRLRKHAVSGAVNDFFVPHPDGWVRLGPVEEGREYVELEIPDCWAEATEAARAVGIAAARPFVRADFYVEGAPVFGEVTPEPSAGHKAMLGEMDEILGEAWTRSL